MAEQEEYIVVTGRDEEDTVTRLTTVEAMKKYLEESGTTIEMTDKEIDMILGYFEGHDYMVGVMEGQFLRGDLCEEENRIPWEIYSVDDMIDAACEWNYELILEEEFKQSHREDSYVDPYPNRYQELKADERVLDRLWDKTKFNPMIDKLAETLADAFIENLGQSVGKESEKTPDTKTIEDAVHTLTEQIKTAGSGGRSR